MWKRVLTFLVFTVFLLQPGRCEILSSSGEAVSLATQSFPMKLYHVTQEMLGTDNFVISPLSLSSIMTMLREGSSNGTRKEFNEALSLKGLDDKIVSEGYHNILSSLQENNGSIVRIVNRIYVSSTGKIIPQFTDILQSKYFTKVLPVNFYKNQEVADDINRWVEESTEGKIANLISPDSIEKDTKAIAVNVIYFKGKWLNEFNIKATREELFHPEDGNGNPTLAMFMEQVDDFPHADFPQFGASSVALPYIGGRFHLVIILPNDGILLSQVEQKLQLSSTSLADIPLKMSRKSVQLLFPKFRLESQVDFTKLGILQKLGLREALLPGEADFSLISDQKLHIDSVIQKCYIDITEEGTEAAGATFTKIIPFNIRRSTSFRVDKPFLAYIYDSVTKSVLFSIRKSKV